MPGRPGSATPSRKSWVEGFRAGARQCIGNDFGLIEATLALATIADRWRLTETADRAFVRPVPRMLLSLTPTPLRLHRRGTSA
jgi:cytochrome P450